MGLRYSKNKNDFSSVLLALYVKWLEFSLSLSILDHFLLILLTYNQLATCLDISPSHTSGEATQSFLRLKILPNIIDMQVIPDIPLRYNIFNGAVTTEGGWLMLRIGQVFNFADIQIFWSFDLSIIPDIVLNWWLLR